MAAGAATRPRTPDAFRTCARHTSPAPGTPPHCARHTFLCARYKTAGRLRRLRAGAGRGGWHDVSPMDANAFYDVHRNALFIPAVKIHT